MRKKIFHYIVDALKERPGEEHTTEEWLDYANILQTSIGAGWTIMRELNYAGVVSKRIDWNEDNRQVVLYKSEVLRSG